MTSIKKWITRGTGYEGFDSYFPTRTEAREHARKILIHGKKRVVIIGKFSEKKYKEGKAPRLCYNSVESWGWVAPRKIGHSSIPNKE